MDPAICPAVLSLYAGTKPGEIATLSLSHSLCRHSPTPFLRTLAIHRGSVWVCVRLVWACVRSYCQEGGWGREREKTVEVMSSAIICFASFDWIDFEVSVCVSILLSLGWLFLFLWDMKGAFIWTGSRRAESLKLSWVPLPLTYTPWIGRYWFVELYWKELV